MSKIVSMFYRSRNDDPELTMYVGNDEKFEDQKELAENWKSKYDDIDWEQEELVKGAGKNGIYTENTLSQQIEFNKLFEEDVEFIGLSLGMGVVKFNSMYPQYYLGVLEQKDNKKAFSDEKISIKKWWDDITSITGSNLYDEIMECASLNEKIILTINNIGYYMIRNDLEKLIDNNGNLLDGVSDVLRFAGSKLEESVHPAFLDLVMPMEQELLDSIVPGSKMHTSKRMAFLMLKTVWEDNPNEHYSALNRELNSDDVYNYPVIVSTNNKNKSLTDDELRELINNEYYDRAHGKSIRISRLLKMDGINVNQNRIDEVMSNNKSVAKVKKTKTRAKAKAKA